MDTKYGKLISRDKNGNLTAVYPEIVCDHEIDFQNKRSVNPVSNYVIAEALEGLKGDIRNAFTSESGGLGWNESTQKGYVDFSKLTAEQVMELCSTNGGIIASDEIGANHGKLAIDFSKMPADQIKNVVNSMVDQTGAIIPNTSVPSTNPNYGKLTVDFSKLTAAQVMALCLTGGGIVADDDTGKLKIDFSKIDEDTKRNITSSLKMQVPLTANKTIYVDNVNGNNTYLDANGIVIEGKGETVGTAFKSIQTAINFATEQWAIGTRTVNILLVSNTTTPYKENITLPGFDRTTGKINIKSMTDSNRAKLCNPNPTGTLISCVGGAYALYNLDLECEYDRVNSGRKNYPNLMAVTTHGDVTLYGCHCKCSYKAGSPADNLWYRITVFAVSNFGAIHFGLIGGSHNTIEYHKNNASQLDVINCANNAILDFNQSGNTEEVVTIDIPVSDATAFNNLCTQASYTELEIANSTTSGQKLVTGKLNVLKSFIAALGLGNDLWRYLASDSMYVVEAWGECTIFCYVQTSSLVRGGSGGTYQQRIHVPKGKTATGRRFHVEYLGGIIIDGIAGAFPGDLEGTCAAGTFSYAKTSLDSFKASTIFDEGFSYLAKTEKATGSKTFGAGLFGNPVAMTANEINLALGTVFTKTITASTTFTITGTPASTAATFNLILTNGGSKTITWPSNVKWADETPPELTASGIDVLTFLTPDGGTTWYGCLALNGAA